MLTKQQNNAISCPGNVLLTACPGSGKTRTLISKLVKEVESVRGTPKAICCITYTNTAVHEIEQRALDQLGSEDERYIYVSTIHSFCLNEIVRPYGWKKKQLSGNLRILSRDNPDFEVICKYAAAKVNMFNIGHSEYDAYESIALDKDGKLVGQAAQNAAVEKSIKYFWEKSAELGYIDFGKIIYGCYRILSENPAIAQNLCARFPWILIDEFQDTSELQIEILKILYNTGKPNFFAVGDLCQSIFGFAGARPELVKPFGEYINAEMDISLYQNFRSCQNIVAHAERLLERSPPMIAAGKNKDFKLQPVLVRNVSALSAIKDQYIPMLAKNGISLGDATVLAKDWASLINLSRGLRDAGVPVVGPGARPYKRSRLFAQLAEQLCATLVEHSTYLSWQFERAFLNCLREITGSYLINASTHDIRLVLVRLLNAAKACPIQYGAIRWLETMSKMAGEIMYDADFITQAQSRLFYASVQEMKADMVRSNTDLENLSVDDLGMFASPSKALRLSTIHYSKGREYDAVAILGLRNGTFPHINANTPDKLVAEKRQLYVGITRARKLLVYVSEQDRFGNPPSSFLGSGGINIL